MEGSWTMALALFFFSITIMYKILKPKKVINEEVGVKVLPTPPEWPLIGHLYLMNGNPFVEMTKLSKIYGEIYFLQLGVVPTVVVSSVRLFKQVLMEKGNDFDSRPDFLRYHVLFGGDKKNSLAFSDWSQVQKTRRALARKFCHSGLVSDRVGAALGTSAQSLIQTIKVNQGDGTSFSNLKMNIQRTCANIFLSFFCSMTFDDTDPEFMKIVRLFDDIFWEINQGHPTDVLPILAPIFRSHLNHVGQMGRSIREFVLERIVSVHMDKLGAKETPSDFVDNLLFHLEEAEPEIRLTMEQILFELEDFIGGHAAVANLLTRALIEIASTPGLSTKIYEQSILNGNAAYMKAIVYETLRKSSSPIVPHVASVDSVIDGFPIKKGSMVMFNNFDLNTSSEYWSEPQAFNPERFLTETGAFRKPSHFLPFSTGKRACMGYKLLEKTTEDLLHSIINNFDLALEGPPIELPQCSIALHPDSRINIIFTNR